MKRKLISMLLCSVMITSAVPVLTHAEADVTAGIKATLRFDYPQTADRVKDSNIKIEMYRGDDIIGEIPFDGDVTGEISGSTNVVKKNTEGGVLGNETEIGYFDVNVSNLSLGDYKFKLSGTGYSDYESKTITLDNYSRQVIFGTGDKTFSIGDVNNDGKVDTTDRDLVTAALGTNNEKYDLNGDGKVNIVDLAYVNHQIGNKGEVQVFDTALIAERAVKTQETENNVKVVEGSVGDMFTENNIQPVTLGAKTENEPIAIPIEFNEPVEMEQIEVISPDTKGALTAGTAEITYTEDGEEKQKEIHFNNAIPDNISLLSDSEETKTVVISLGRRVAVKKVVINVTQVQGEDGTPAYAVVQEVKFLKDIVPENPAPQVLSVQNVTAQPLNESVKLTWDEFPNISGYKVLYGLENGKFTDEMAVDVNTAVISGLKNLKTYYFTVIPTSDGWEGGRSEVISAIPQPNSVPLKPDMVTVREMDGALALSWKETENAVYYNVYYKKSEEADSAYTQAGGNLTEPSFIIPKLENDVEYSLYIVAGNNIGKGPKSDIYAGIPHKDVTKAPDIPTLHRIPSDNIEKIEMGNPNNYNRNEYPNGFSVNNVADDDFGTHWTARAFWESSQFTFTFKNAKEMNYMVYAPRQDGKYRRSLARYSITVWDEDGNEKQLVNGKGITVNSTETGYAILEFERTKVKKLAVSTAQWEGSPTGLSLSEAVFYEADNLASDVKALFADNTYTTLTAEAKADKTATQQKIEALRAEANNAEGYYVDKDVLLDELSLAEGLLNNDSDALGLVKTGIQSRSTGADGAKYGQSGSDLQPLGVVAYATEFAQNKKLEETKVTIYANIPEGENVYVVPTQYFAEANAWQGGAIALKNGRNIIEIPKIGAQTTERGGSLYIRYSGNKADEISLHARMGVTPIPMLELSDWYAISEDERRTRIGEYIDTLVNHTKNYNMTQTGIYNSTEISMPNVLLSVAAQPVLKAVKPTDADRDTAIENMYNNVLAWEDIMHICNTTQGIDNTLSKSDMQSRQNIRYMRMFAKAFMYAAGSHVGIGYGSVGGMASGKPASMIGENAVSNNIFGWGIAHEIGHNMDKLGKAEITNNIYSLMVQTYDGKENTLPSRLEKSNKYAGIYKKVSEGRKGMSNDVFVQLGMYWQLHLAYDDGENPLNFYNKLFKEWKSGSVTAPTSDERFALAASKIANKNLTDFFTSWGVDLSDTVKAQLKNYPAEARSIQYLCDESRRYRLAGGKAAVGTTTAKAQLDGSNEKQINLTFSNTADKNSILGYEIKRNGKTVAFATENTYTDIIGSANNTSFSYSVQAIDMLGNKVGAAADAGQVRISYVKTIDKNAYTEKRNADGSISVTMNKTTAVSGVKITNAPKTGKYTVSVTDEKTTVAKNGDFSVNETPEESYYVAYFNKPNTSDTRIWTYDAKEITVTGVPQDAVVEFISYAGDNIEFTSDAAVGKLKNDYVYDNGKGGQDTIKAGTIVVTGTYRGDPLYNTIQINGKFVSVNPETNEETVVERAIDGYSLLFAEIPADGEVSDISDGIFIFVPNVQKEAELQGKGDAHDCSAVSLLPAQIKAEIYRTDTIENTESKRKTSDTIWITSPSINSMPDIILEGDEN